MSGFGNKCKIRWIVLDGQKWRWEISKRENLGRVHLSHGSALNLF